MYCVCVICAYHTYSRFARVRDARLLVTRYNTDSFAGTIAAPAGMPANEDGCTIGAVAVRMRRRGSQNTTHTHTSLAGPRSLTTTRTKPPSGVNLTALSVKLSKHCCSLMASPSSHWVDSRVGTSSSRVRPFSWAYQEQNHGGKVCLDGGGEMGLRRRHCRHGRRKARDPGRSIVV